MSKAAKPKKCCKDEKNDQKLADEVLENLNKEFANATLEDRFAMLLHKYIDEESVVRRLKRQLKAQENALKSVTNKKERIENELRKGLKIWEKLGELGNLMKTWDGEVINKIKEEECQSKCQYPICKEATQAVNKCSEENLTPRDPNVEIKKVLNISPDQRMCEEQLCYTNKQIQMLRQLYQAKLQNVGMGAEKERKSILREEQIVLERYLDLQNFLKDMIDIQVALQEQLNFYISAYNEKQKTDYSFASFKEQLKEMYKTTFKLEKEYLKWEDNSAAVIELTSERKERKQIWQLQKLLRAMQYERTHLYKVMRENNVECPPLPVLPPEPVIQAPPATSDKVMLPNFPEFRLNLATLQSQIRALFLTINMGPDIYSKLQGIVSYTSPNLSNILSCDNNTIKCNGASKTKDVNTRHTAAELKNIVGSKTEYEDKNKSNNSSKTEVAEQAVVYVPVEDNDELTNLLKVPVDSRSVSEEKSTEAIIRTEGDASESVVGVEKKKCNRKRKIKRVTIK